MALLDPQLVWNGLVSGSLIALAALGLTLIFGILNFINIAYGDYMAFGAYVALAANTSYGLNIALAAVAGIVGGAVIASVSDRLVFRQFRDRNPIVLLVVSLGLGFIVRNFIRAVWGGDVRYYQIPLEEGPQFFGVTIVYDQLAIIALSLLVLALIFLLLGRTRIGIAMRAASDDTDLARLRGIDTERLTLYVAVIGGMVAAAAGISLGVDANLRPNMGFAALIPVFAAVILGGIGDPRGAVIGGYTIGLAQEISVTVIPTEYKPLIGLLLLVAGLIWRPDGIFGETTR